MIPLFKNGVSANHHLESISTSPQFFARQIFFTVGPISGISTSMQRHLAVYTSDPQFRTVLATVQYHSLPYSVHVNRTRFWVDVQPPMYSYFALTCKDITHEKDHALGV